MAQSDARPAHKESAVDEDQPADFTAIAKGVYLEGLAFDFCREVIWFSDVIGGGIHGVKPDGTPVATFNAERMWTGGVLMNDDGAVLSTGQGGIMWNHPESGRSGWLIDRIDGASVNGINELVPDGTGGIVFGTIDLDSVVKGDPPGPSAIYRLSASRELTKLADLGFANGLMFDAARQRLYCNDTFTCAWSFDVGRDFALTNRQTFAAKDDADGMALDAEGNVWITGFRSRAIIRITPEGSEQAPLRGPPGAITQVRFGGADLCDIYLNSVPSGGGDSLKDGVPIEGKRSFLYKGRSIVPGMALAPARFQLG